MRMISLTNASSVVEPDTGEQYDAGPDGVFDLPHPFAMHLADKHAGHWRVESEHEAALTAAKVTTLRNPNVLPGVVATLRDDLDGALARIEALEAAAAKPARSRSGAKPKADDPAE